MLGSSALRLAVSRLAAGRTVSISGVWGSSQAAIAAALHELSASRLVVVVTSHLDQADEVVDDMEVLTGRPATLFPAWETELSAGAEHISDDVAGERVRVCNELLRLGTSGAMETERGRDARDTLRVLVMPVLALLQPVPTPEALAAGRLTLRRGQEVESGSLARWLVDAGFERVDQVDQQGEFAQRGGIVDVFPVGAGEAVRVEFWGDTIDSIRRLDLDTQRSRDDVESYDVTGTAAGRAMDPRQSRNLLEYLPAGSVIVMPEPAEVMELANEVYRRVATARGAAEPRSTGVSPSRPAGILSVPDSGVASSSIDQPNGAHNAGETPASRCIGLHDPAELFLALPRFALVELHAFAGSASAEATEMNLAIRSLERLALNTHEALVELSQLAAVNETWVYCENPAEESRFGELLGEQYPELAARVRTQIGHLGVGFHWPERRLVLVGHHELYHRYNKVRKIRRIRAGRPIDSLLDLLEGDYVVHVAHGIAKFEGLHTLHREGQSEEYLRLRFAENAVLNVPASSINLVQKYIGSGARKPTLSHLGGSGWQKQKTRVAAAVHDMAAGLLRVQAARAAQPGIAYANGTDWQRQFSNEFIYTETEDQLTSMKQIDEDMAQPRPMDRLLCGDVGYGKTELAMRSAFKVAESGRQVAVLVPTTVLAAQHFRTFTERFADYPFRVDVLSRFRSKKEQQAVIEKLALGQIDILIGTHRLLSKDVRFPDLGLVVIDEEQRFGVEHKERLKNLRATVEVLTMTATPIPRTLHMALLGLRDISSLTTPPLDRRAIHTEVRPYDDDLIRMAIGRELNRQGQVFFVHNRVNDIESLAAHIQSLVPEIRIAIGHGQMPEGALEKIMMRFLKRDVDVLLCTTIVESGLDIPTANTMIIHDADRFGLAELHQLRGRVGRYKHRAYCYLLLPQTRPVTLHAAKRLKAIEDFSDLGAGFQIAMRDLEIRGAGNILGPEQSGFIAAVGYELYCQLLEKSVRELRGEAAPVRHEVHVEIGVDSFVPREYVPAERQRMEIYRRIVRCAAVEELEQLRRDVQDAYGRIPPAMQTLLDLAEVRVLAGQSGIRSVIKIEPDLVFTFRDFGPAKKLFDGAHGSVRLADDKTVYWRPPKAYLEMPTLLNVLLTRLRRART